jgi:HrpA-like RNA helicase
MSATVDPLVFANFFKKNNLTFKHHHVEAAKPKYTIDKIFLDKQIEQKDYPNYAQAYLDQILKLTTDGDIIVFFPTLTPAKKIIDKLTKPANLKLYHGKPCFVAYSGTAPQEDKDLVQKKDEIRKLPYYKIKGYSRIVILTTPAAESSLTTSGNVVYVIEPGYAKSVWYDPTIFGNVAAEVYITKASITQRQGRTGRVCNGQAYMLYTKEFFDNLPEYNEPDILKSDLTNDILSIMNLPVTRNLTGTLKFLSNLITPPTIENVEAGVKILYNYSMIDSYGEITDMGRACIKLSKLGPEIARMVMVSYYFNCMEDIVLLAAMMISTQGKGIKDFIKPPPLFNPTREETEFYKKTMEHFKHPRGDHFTLIKILKEYMMIHPLDRRRWCQKFKFSYDLFNNSIEPDLKSIRDSLQNVEFPQMFTHYPPPPKFEKPPRDLLEYLKLHNKKLMDQMFGDKLPQNRFNFQYGGSSRDNLDLHSDRDTDRDTDTDTDSDSELKGGFFSKSFFVEKKNQQNKKKQKNKKNEKTGISLKEHINKKLQKLENDFNINKNNDDNDNNNIESSRKSLDIKKTKRNVSKSIALWDVKEDIKINKSHTKRLINIVRSKYTGKHIKDLDLNPKLKEVLLSDTKKIYDIKDENDTDYDGDDDDIGNIKDEENLLKDDFYTMELQPEIKTKSDFIDEFNTNQQLTQSLIKLKEKLFNPKSEIKIKSKKLKSNSKSKSYKKSHKKLLFGQGPKLKLKKTMKRQFGSGKDDDKKIMEEEKKKFGAFLDSISLKTESGILPMFRLFENHDENILACIFYGFYMRLGVNYYKKDYLLKLSKLDKCSFINNTLDYDNQRPELIIYQNLTLGKSADIGIVSAITPRIINAFI